ncbi:MAG: type IV secretion system DNA-binding domain-containing protein [Acidimicrobiales bacterium]
MPSTPTPSTPTPSAPTPSGPLARYLLHPGAETGHLLHQADHVLVVLGTHLGPPVLGVLAVVAVAIVVSRHRAGAAMVAGARQVTVLAPPEVDPDGAAVLWSNLVALLRPAWRRATGRQPHLGFELTAGPAGLAISLWVPGSVPPGLVERAVEAAWPGAATETTPATTPLVGLWSSNGSVATGGALRLAAGDHYPLKTDHRVDPLRPLLGALSGLGEHEQACVQILARPVTGRRLRALSKAAVHRRNGRPARRTGRILDLVTPGGTGPPARPADVDPARSADVSAILDKAAQPCWAIAIRYGVTTDDPGPQARAALRGRAHAVASAFAVYAGRNHLDRHRLRRPSKTLAARRLGRGDLVSVAELAALAHLPTDVTVAGLARAGAKAVAPPPPVAQLVAARSATPPGSGRPGTGRASSGDRPASELKVLGDAEAGSRRPVALAVADVRHHLHVMGATGSGKSTLLTNLILDDIAAGRGAVVIDPKGDLVTDLCDRLPAGAEARTVLIDPAERHAPPVLNVLAGPDPDLVVDNLVGIFRNIFAAYWGPRTDDVLRAACLTLRRTDTAEHPASLADVPRLLSDEGFRAPKVAAVNDDAIGLGGFWRWYDQLGTAAQSQVVGPLMNKLRAFLLRDFARQVVGRGRSSIDMGKVLDGGICLVRVPKGLLGDDTARLLGSFIVAAVWQAATHRARLGQAARVDCSLYVDECQNFLNLPRSFEELLAEARGYRLSLVLAHQHLAQLPRDLRDAVSSNARTKVWFSMSPEDAHTLGRHVAPEVTEHDLAHLGAYQAAARLVVDGRETPACTLRTRPAPPATCGRGEAVRAAARATFGRRVEPATDAVNVDAAPEAMAPEAMGTEAATSSTGRRR